MQEDLKQDSNKYTLKNALCYLPFVSIIFFFTETKKSIELMKHIKYGTMLFTWYILFSVFFYWIVWLAILLLIYIIIVWIFFFKVYSWWNVQIWYFDDIETTLREKWNDVEKKESEK